jgi:hypothetical protein
MQFLWGSNLLQLADPAVISLVYTMSYRAFLCKLQNIGPCKYFALYMEFLYTGQLSVNCVDRNTRL